MSIEGDRYAGGVFNPGQPLSASHMNDIAGSAARGHQFYSTGQLVTQGTFGTVDLSNQPADLKEFDQFHVTCRKYEGKYWFKIVPGYCTVLDHFILMSASGNGTISVGDSTLLKMPGYDDLGVTNLYTVDSCNAFGDKIDQTKPSLLSQNEFRANDSEESEEIIIFLYRHTPGGGTPKMGIMTMDYFYTWWRSGNGYPVNVYQPNMGSNAGIISVLGYTPVTDLYGGPIPVTSLSDLTRREGVRNLGFRMRWDKLGLHVQPLAIFNKTTKSLQQIKRGHVLMNTSPESYSTVSN